MNITQFKGITAIHLNPEYSRRMVYFIFCDWISCFSFYIVDILAKIFLSNWLGIWGYLILTGGKGVVNRYKESLELSHFVLLDVMFAFGETVYLLLTYLTPLGNFFVVISTNLAPYLLKTCVSLLHFSLHLTS